ncbi:hypothetical protein EYC80_005905 [Monilinia laxa]|uniref:Uncharacterized protein n=1 Tax=Monilinia laxa TaxID=61186 RepID=A0A5N6KFH5_MONLA|nr:hypothetical protein EYC80_005905 [Monilinia laxa]
MGLATKPPCVKEKPEEFDRYNPLEFLHRIPRITHLDTACKLFHPCLNLLCDEPLQLYTYMMPRTPCEF